VGEGVGGRGGGNAVASFVHASTAEIEGQGQLLNPRRYGCALVGYTASSVYI
jgi:hypothetical protein